MHARLLLLLFVLPALLGAPGAHASDAADPQTARLVSNTSLTPDGRTLVFAWRGDLWRVSSEGGDARRLTFHPARDTTPRVSPDGKTIAFISNREGTDQVFLMPISGGRPRQVTLHTEGFSLQGWFPNGEALLVRARLDHGWMRSERLFRRSLDPDAPLELLFDAYAGGASVSPDGRHIAFTREGVAWWRKEYHGSQAGQIWIYDLEKETFKKITEGEHGERYPCWSGDGTHLYVTSQQDGTFNLWEHDLANGTRRQRTFFEDDGVLFPSISADGSMLVFRRLFDLWRFETDLDGTPIPIEIVDRGDPTVETHLNRTLTRADDVAFTDDAREIAFTAGGDLWVMDTELREPKRITDTPEEEREPVFSPDHATLYFVSDAGGRTDLWKAERNDADKHWWQNEAFDLERLTDDEAAERWPAFTPDGKRLVYVKGQGDLWTSERDGSDPRRLIASWDAPSYDFSPDGQWIAYAVDDPDFNSDVWIARVDGQGEPFNLSRHPDWDGAPTWSPDGRLLAFSSRRWRDESDLCYVWLRAEDEEREKRDRALEKALARMKGRKGKPKPAARPAPKPTPKATPKTTGAQPSDPVSGTWRGLIRGDPPVPSDGLSVTLVIRREASGSAAGTIDIPGFFSGDLEGLQIDMAENSVTFSIKTPLGPLTGDATLDGQTMRGTWSIPGLGDGTFELAHARLNEEGGETAPEAPKTPAKKKPKRKKPVVVDFEGLEDRIHRISIPDTSERRLLWSPDSKRLAFEATVGGARGIYTVTFPDSLSPKRLTTTTGTHARWLAEGNQIVRLTGGQPATLSASGKSRTYPFRVNQTVDLAARNAAAFDQAWRVMRDAFYDPRMNNRDWDRVRAKYRPLALCAVRIETLDQLVDMMLGEINGSHLGFSAGAKRWSKPGWRPVTRHLGVRFERVQEGPGLLIRDVMRGSPASKARSRLEPGERILAIDGHPVEPSTRLTRLLTGPGNQPLLLRVAAADGAERDVTLRPTTYRAVRVGLYEETLQKRREAVEQASAGRLGYLHVRGMNWSSFERFETELYKVAHGKDGLVIDVRDNGGGFTADHLLTILTQPNHAFTVPRGGKAGYPQDRMVYARWGKPIVVLCNQNSFSNAEIFAHAAKTLHRGKVVGVPTAGGVISTGATSIMGLGTLRLPFRGWFLLDSGEDMEHNGCVPDVVVWPQPGEMPAGIDRQIEAAVKVLLEEVQALDMKQSPTARYASER